MPPGQRQLSFGPSQGSIESPCNTPRGVRCVDHRLLHNGTLANQADSQADSQASSQANSQPTSSGKAQYSDLVEGNLIDGDLIDDQSFENGASKNDFGQSAAGNAAKDWNDSCGTL